MALNTNTNIETYITALEARLTSLESVAAPIIVTKSSSPTQKDWETAWVNAGNALPISDRQTFIWDDGWRIQGMYSAIFDTFFVLYEKGQVDIAGVTHWKFNRFLGWIDDEHFYADVDYINASGTQSGLVKCYLDGTFEAVTLTGFSPTTMLNYDASVDALWYIESTAIKYIVVGTESITTVIASTTTQPANVVFDGSGDAFFLAQPAAGTLEIQEYDWSGTSVSGVITTITVNGGSESPGNVIGVSNGYLMVDTSAANYWVQVDRATWSSEGTVKSSTTGATSATLPAVTGGTSWTQRLMKVNKTTNVFYIAYTVALGKIAHDQWERTIEWNAGTETDTDVAGLPFQKMISTMKSEEPAKAPLDWRRQRPSFFTTTLYRRYPVSDPQYLNATSFHPNDNNDRYVIVTDTREILFSREALGSSLRVWRLSRSGENMPDVMPIKRVYLAENPNDPHTFDLINLPEGYNMVEIITNLNYSGTVPTNVELVFNWSGGSLGLKNTTDQPNLEFYGGIFVDSNEISAEDNTDVQFPGQSTSTDGAMQRSIIMLETDRSEATVIQWSGSRTGTAGELEAFALTFRRVKTSSPATPFSSISIPGADNGYLNVQAYRTEERRLGGSYYAPGLA